MIKNFCSYIGECITKILKFIIKILKLICCKIGWHSFIVGYDIVEVPSDPLKTGICDKCKCKWCGYIGMVDSQGNLF